jgi:glycosyltransferase involved in cell wall biosynthesis
MAGPGIRYCQLAHVLSAAFSVVLAAPGGSTFEDEPGISGLVYATARDPALAAAVEASRAVLVPAVLVADIPSLSGGSVPLIVDGYDPVLAETLALQGNGLVRLRHALAQAYRAGDFFICASERQRDWWLGLLEAYGRVNAHTFADSPSLRRLVDVVPFGLPKEPLQATGPAIKGVWPGVSRDSKVVLWGGGLWPWLDPLTGIRAMVHVREARQDVKLVFPGTRHPNPGMSDLPTLVERAIRLARDLDLLDHTVVMGGWVPFAEWPNVLAESDVALTLHLDTLEARLAFRTRTLDYIWAGIPVVATRGDVTASLIEAHGLGTLVDHQDEVAVADAILSLLDGAREDLSPGLARARQALSWEKAAEPLIAFCRSPRQAADKAFLDPLPEGPACADEIARLRALVAGFEGGRFIRFTRWLHRMRRRIGGQG